MEIIIWYGGNETGGGVRLADSCEEISKFLTAVGILYSFHKVMKTLPDFSNF